MIAVDSNVLIYAHRKESPWYNVAHRCIAQLAEGRASWAIPWPCIHEFLSIVTHRRVYSPPTPLTKAIAQVDVWLQSPSLTLLSESDRYWPDLCDCLRDGRIEGPRVHDARIAALCRLHGVTELWTADRDFSRFPGLGTRNPLIE